MKYLSAIFVLCLVVFVRADNDRKDRYNNCSVQIEEEAQKIYEDIYAWSGCSERAIIKDCSEASVNLIQRIKEYFRKQTDLTEPCRPSLPTVYAHLHNFVLALFNSGLISTEIEEKALKLAVEMRSSFESCCEYKSEEECFKPSLEKIGKNFTMLFDQVAESLGVPEFREMWDNILLKLYNNECFTVEIKEKMWKIIDEMDHFYDDCAENKNEEDCWRFYWENGNFSEPMNSVKECLGGVGDIQDNWFKDLLLFNDYECLPAVVKHKEGNNPNDIVHLYKKCLHENGKDCRKSVGEGFFRDLTAPVEECYQAVTDVQEKWSETFKTFRGDECFTDEIQKEAIQILNNMTHSYIQCPRENGTECLSSTEKVAEKLLKELFDQIPECIEVLKFREMWDNILLKLYNNECFTVEIKEETRKTVDEMNHFYDDCVQNKNKEDCWKFYWQKGNFSVQINQVKECLGGVGDIQDNWFRDLLLFNDYECLPAVVKHKEGNKLNDIVHLYKKCLHENGKDCRKSVGEGFFRDLTAPVEECYQAVTDVQEKWSETLETLGGDECYFYEMQREANKILNNMSHSYVQCRQENGPDCFWSTKKVAETLLEEQLYLAEECLITQKSISVNGDT